MQQDSGDKEEDQESIQLNAMAQLALQKEEDKKKNELKKLKQMEQNALLAEIEQMTKNLEQAVDTNQSAKSQPGNSQQSIKEKKEVLGVASVPKPQVKKINSSNMN